MSIKKENLKHIRWKCISIKNFGCWESLISNPVQFLFSSKKSLSYCYVAIIVFKNMNYFFRNPIFRMHIRSRLSFTSKLPCSFLYHVFLLLLSIKNFSKCCCCIKHDLIPMNLPNDCFARFRGYLALGCRHDWKLYLCRNVWN